MRTARRKRGKKEGGGRKSALHLKHTYAALLFPLLPPCATHHSASDDRNWRNLLFNGFFHGIVQKSKEVIPRERLDSVHRLDSSSNGYGVGIVGAEKGDGVIGVLVFDEFVYFLILRTNVGDVFDLGKVPPPIFSPFRHRCEPPFCQWRQALAEAMTSCGEGQKTADTHFCQELPTHVTFLFGFCSN